MLDQKTQTISSVALNFPGFTYITLTKYEPNVIFHIEKKVSPCDILSHMLLLVVYVQLCPNLCDLWTVAHQVPLSMEFSRQKYWSGKPLPFPGVCPSPGLNPGLLHCRQVLYLTEPSGKPLFSSQLIYEYLEGLYIHT